MRKIKRNNRFGSMAIAVLACLMSFADTMAQKQFTLEDLNFGGKNFYNMIPENRYADWWGETLVRLDAENCSTIDTKTGKENVIFNLEDINKWANTPEEAPVRSLYNAKFPYPGKPYVLVKTKAERVLVDFKKHNTVWRQSCKDEEFGDWNDQSKALAFVKDNQLYVTDANGETKKLTEDGSREIVYGQAVHRNEFGIMKGTFWSNNGEKLAFYRMDQSMVTDYPQVDIFPKVAAHEPDKYPMAGDASHKVTVGVYDMKTGNTVYLKAGDPTDRYFTNIAWSPDDERIYMFELNRDQNDCRLVSYDAGTGEKLGEIYRETHPKYVEPMNPIMFLPWDASKFIMQSQKDGFKHLYLYDINGKELRQITSGEWVVMGVLGFNSKTKSVIIQSNEASPLQCNTYSVNIQTGKRTALDNGKGWHYGKLSANGTLLYDSFSEPDVPRKIEIANTATAKRTLYFAANNPWDGYDVPTYEAGTIKAADGVTDLYYRMVKPKDFDTSKKYPTVVYVYGGPHAHNVDARWHYGSRSWETYMAQKGYVLFIIDNRGSENRGREFEQATFRQLGQIEMQDQMKGVEFLKSLPYVDSNRLGVHGWSFGGFMTISLMTNYPDVFKVGVAGGPVIDWKWYEVMYGERYMDTPQSNPEGYEKTSLLNKAKDLKGKLQIITGYNDATVVPQHCLSFIAKCIEEGTQPDFFVYPGEPHNMRGHQSVHLHERITQYFEDYLK